MRASRLVLAVVVAHPVAAGADAVTLDDAARVIREAITKIDGTAPVGETLAIASLAPGDPRQAVDTTRLRAALARAKLRIVDDYQYGQGVVVTVEDAGGARARIAAEPGGGAIHLTARPASIKPPGRCVPIPQARHPVYVNSSGVDQDGELHHGQTFWDYKTERIHDVDGDGITDAFVPIAKRHACPEAVTFRVFVVRGSCGHDVGVIGPGSFAWDAATVARDPSGYRPFTMTAETSRHGRRGIPELTTATRRFAFKSGKYRQVDVQRRTGVCHHCSTWSCNSP